MTTPPSPHLLLRAITTSGAQSIDVGTINVLVGPNNSGKSESLCDLARLAGNYDPSGADRAPGEEPRTHVIHDVTFVSKLSVERLMRGITRNTSSKGDGNVIQGLAPDMQSPYRRSAGSELKNILFRPVITARSVWSTSLGEVMPLRVAYVPAGRRQNWVTPGVASHPLHAPENLLQALQYAPETIHVQLDEAVAAIFDGIHVRLDATEIINLSLRVAKKFPPRTGNTLEDIESHQSLRRLDEEGDGLKSCVAMLLAMLLGEGRIILLEHPEAYLASEQARRLGVWIADHAARLGLQVFVTTNDTSFLGGLMSGPVDVTMLRLSRRDNITRVSRVAPETGKTMVTNPLLSTQDALQCFFRDGVVLLSDDADRVLHRAVAERFLRVHNLAFLHSHGVRNLAKVAGVLRNAQAPACVVAELDVLQHEQSFIDLVKALSNEPPPQPWLATRDRLASHVEGWYDARELKSSAHEVEAILDQLKHGNAVTEVKAPALPQRRTMEKWERFRSERLGILPAELRVWVEEMLEDFKRIGLFISPTGRWQGWLNESGSKEDQTLLQRAIESLEKGECPAELKAFVAEVTAFVRASGTAPRAARASHGT